MKLHFLLEYKSYCRNQPKVRRLFNCNTQKVLQLELMLLSQRENLIICLSAQLVRIVKIGKYVAIEKKFQNALYVKIVKMLKIVIYRGD